MGHKIHPSGLRLGITQEHRSKWFATSKTYPILLQEDFKIRTFIQKKYGAAGISDVLIARKADQLELELKTARPGVIVGRQGSGIEELRSGIQKTIGDRTRQVRINVVEVERVDADAFLLAEYIAQQLEKRVAFRRTIRMALQRAQRAGVLGLKIQVGGRLNGAEIARKADQLELELKTARPGVIVGRQGSGIEELRSGIQKTIGDRTRQVRINVVEVERVDADAFLLAEYIAQQLEKRVAFRRTIRMALQRAQRAGVLGLKIQVGGRLNGAEIARTEWTREGRVPLHTLRAEIDYATREANTTYGVLGIKVWVFKGEVLPKEEQTIPVGASPKRKASRRPQQFEDRSNENS